MRRALEATAPEKAADLLFLEQWEIDGRPCIWSTLRASQIRRANPELAAALRTELSGARRACPR